MSNHMCTCMDMEGEQQYSSKNGAVFNTGYLTWLLGSPNRRLACPGPGFSSHSIGTMCSRNSAGEDSVMAENWTLEPDALCGHPCLTTPSLWVCVLIPPRLSFLICEMGTIRLLMSKGCWALSELTCPKHVERSLTQVSHSIAVSIFKKLVS